MFMLWQRGEKELKKFLQYLNCYHSTIKFTAIYSHEEINFLDVSVRIKKTISGLSLKKTPHVWLLHAKTFNCYGVRFRMTYEYDL